MVLSVRIDKVKTCRNGATDDAVRRAEPLAENPRRSRHPARHRAYRDGLGNFGCGGIVFGLNGKLSSGCTRFPAGSTIQAVTKTRSSLSSAFGLFSASFPPIMERSSDYRAPLSGRPTNLRRRRFAGHESAARLSAARHFGRFYWGLEFCRNPKTPTIEESLPN
jgi:hypothetical protein